METELKRIIRQALVDYLNAGTALKGEHSRHVYDSIGHLENKFGRADVAIVLSEMLRHPNKVKDVLKLKLKLGHVYATASGNKFVVSKYMGLSNCFMALNLASGDDYKAFRPDGKYCGESPDQEDLAYEVEDEQY